MVFTILSTVLLDFMVTIDLVSIEVSELTEVLDTGMQDTADTVTEMEFIVEEADMLLTTEELIQEVTLEALLDVHLVYTEEITDLLDVVMVDL